MIPTITDVAAALVAVFEGERLTLIPTITDVAAALVAVFEGERLTPYQDGGGVWTNGIGNTHGVVPGLAGTITHTQAVADFARNAKPLLDLVITWPIGLAAALVSFGFNCGQAAMLRAMADHSEILQRVHTTDRHGAVEPGLVTRRRLEYTLCEMFYGIKA